jgi:serine/threonine protein kinase
MWGMIAPGTVLQDRYLLTKQIGQGGMGAVYIATDQRFGSTVAVKETLFDDPNLRKAFEREARLLNSLRHTALPRVSDHFVEAEGQFLVMEFIGGDDLSAMLEQNGGPFPVDRVLGWAEQLLDALEYLHDQNPPIIHRDIKPQNLKLTERDHIILLDFGLAKGQPSHLSRVTNTGSVFGYSRSYAPLEQIQGAGTDTRSDLYSLAATLYHLLTGVTPPDAVTRATAIINGHPDPMRPAHEINPKVSADISGLLGRALAQNANQRPASARVMRHTLQTADRTPSANRATVLAAADPTIFDQATQLLSPSTRPDAGVMSDIGAANTVPDLNLMATDPRPSGTAAGDSVMTQVTPTKPARGSRVRWLASAVVLLLLGGAAFAIYRYNQTAASSDPLPVYQPVQNVTVPSPTPTAPAPSPTPAATEAKNTGEKGKASTKHPQGGGGTKVTVGDNDPDVDVPEPPDPDDRPLPPDANQGEIERKRAAAERRRIQIQINRDLRRRQQQQMQNRNRPQPRPY